MSGGTRQKLNAAAAYLFRPSLVILDEPSAGLDPIANGILTIDPIAQGQTVITVRATDLDGSFKDMQIAVNIS